MSTKRPTSSPKSARPGRKAMTATKAQASKALIHTQKTFRHAIYKSTASKFPLCIAAAKSPSDALRIARQHGFRLSPTAYAIRETTTEPF